MDKNKYAGEIDLVIEKRDTESIILHKKFNGLVKVSPIIHLDSEKISTFFLLGLGGGYVEGEKYRYTFTLNKGSRAIITTQASTKIYKCPNKIETYQETQINLKENSILEYITDPVILYKDAIYKQENSIYMDESATFIYTDGITSGWSPTGDEFQYNRVQLKTDIYINNKIVFLDNLIINPKKDNVEDIGYFEGYSNFGTLIVINKDINDHIIVEIRKYLNQLNLPIYYGISELEVSGFVLRVLGNLTKHIDTAIQLAHNIVRKRILGSNNLFIRKY